jgi:hypothetical protein
MDYSLLVGVKRRTFLVNPPSNRSSLMMTGSSINTASNNNPTTNAINNAILDSVRTSSVSAETFSPGVLLSTIHNPPPQVDGATTATDFANHLEALNKGQYLAAAVEGAGGFYFGIIDILQEWNWQKWYERMFKIHILRKDGAGLSAIEPHQYRKRFLQRAVIDIFSGVDALPNDDTGEEEKENSTNHNTNT